MSPSEIRKAAKAARDEIKRARGEVEIAIAKLRVIQSMCDHPERFTTSCMGELGTRCADCGHES